MITKQVKLDPHSPDQQVLREAGEIIKNGGLVAFPTETVYGLGANGLDEEAAKKTYAAKGRPCDNPLIIHIARWEDLSAITKNLPEVAEVLGRHFWPGPFTMILEKSERVPHGTTGGLETVAVRMPENAIARELIMAAGGYVSAPSANLSGKPSPTCGDHVMTDLYGSIEMVLDGGVVTIGIESTILDLTVTPPAILRPGKITKGEIEEVIGSVVEITSEGSEGEGEQTDPKELKAPKVSTGPKAPGTKYRHYAPDGVMQIVEGELFEEVAAISLFAREKVEAGYKVGIIASAETAASYPQGIVKNLGSRTDEETIARNLYRILREFNEEEVAYIYSESFPVEGYGGAIQNRLNKAAGQARLMARDYLDL